MKHRRFTESAYQIHRARGKHAGAGTLLNCLVPAFRLRNDQARRRTNKMRFLTIVAACVALGGCWTSGQEAATANRPGDQFVGQNVDAVVARFGKPSGRKKMDNDQMTYVWEFAAADLPSNQTSYTGQAGLYGDGRTPGSMSEAPRFCKISVVTS